MLFCSKVTMIQLFWIKVFGAGLETQILVLLASLSLEKSLVNNTVGKKILFTLPSRI